MDVLAEVLALMHVGNALVGQAELVAPWGLDVDANIPAAIHIVQRGDCWLRLPGEPRARHLAQGDLVLIAGGARHALSDAPATATAPYKQALASASRRARRARPRAVRSTVLFCAEYTFDQDGVHPLLTVLPRVIHVAADVGQADSALQALVRVLLHEATQRRSGAELVLPRLIDCLLVLVIRHWLDGQPAGTAGWFGALRDPAIGRALALIHARPAQRWTVEALALRVSQSRATFARRFSALVGAPPLVYANRWRMCLATQLLRTTDLTLDEIAERVGYDSASAFGKAFQRQLETTPGRYRSARVGASG